MPSVPKACRNRYCPVAVRSPATVIHHGWLIVPGPLHAARLAVPEKAISIGSWCVTMGIPTHVGANVPVHGSALVHGVVTNVAEDVFGGYLILEEDPIKGAAKLIEKLDERAWRLRIRKGYKAKLSELAGK